MLPEALPNSRAPSLRGHYPASSLLRTRPPPSRLQPISRGHRLYGLPAPPISRRDEEGFSSCSTCPGHRAVAPTPPEGPAASARLRRSLLPSRGSATARPPGLGAFGATSAFTPVTARRLAHHSFRWLRRWAPGRSVSLRPAIQATGRLALAPVGLSPTEHVCLPGRTDSNPCLSRDHASPTISTGCRLFSPRNGTGLKPQRARGSDKVHASD